MLENFQGDSWGLIPPLRMPCLLPHDLCHGQSSLPEGWRSFPANIRQRGKCIQVQGRLPLTVDWMTGQLKGKLADHWFPGWTQPQGPNISAHPSAPYLLEAVSTLLFECLWHFKRRKVSRILRHNNRKTEGRLLFFTSFEIKNRAYFQFLKNLT